jgi:cytochrome c-type biogenesis protein CcmH
MLLWIIMTVMTAAAAVWLSAPLLRSLDNRRAAAASELEVYRDQLSEVEREKADGVIEPAQADAAVLEIKRRMLSAERNPAADISKLSLGEQHLSVATVAGIVVLGSVILYANSGRPDLPSVARAPTTLVLGDGAQAPTFRSAQGGSAPAVASAPAVGTAPESAATAPAQSAGTSSLGTVDDMIARLVDRLKKDPGNVETLRMLGWSYFSTDRFVEAADAYRKATQLQPKNPALQTSYGEALVRAGDGTVKADAIAAFDAALAVDSKEPRARYFKGLVKEQSGDKKGALETWIAVLGDAAADDAWATELRARVLELASELGVDVAARLPAPAGGSGVLQALKDQDQRSAAAPAPAPTVRGPTADDVKAAQSMTPADRAAMIRGMVDGLSARLEKSPRDADGWIQLIRSRKVLGEAEAAKASLNKALSVFEPNSPERNRIAAAAQEIGIAP